MKWHFEVPNMASGDIAQCSSSHMGTPVSMADLCVLYSNNQ